MLSNTGTSLYSAPPVAIQLLQSFDYNKADVASCMSVGIISFSLLLSWMIDIVSSAVLHMLCADLYFHRAGLGPGSTMVVRIHHHCAVAIYMQFTTKPSPI